MKKIIRLFFLIILFGCNSKEDAKYYFNIGETKYKLKEFSNAIKEYSKAIDIYSDYFEAYNARGKSNLNLFDYKNALLDFSKAIEIDPKSAITYINRGDVKIFLDEYQGAINDYTSAIKICKGSNDKIVLSNAYNKRGVAKSYLSDSKGERNDYNSAIKENPKNSDVYNNLASSIILNGPEIKEVDANDWPNSIIMKAVDSYIKSKDLNDKNANAIYNYYILSYLLGAPNYSFENKAIELNPNYSSEDVSEYNFIDLRTTRSIYGFLDKGSIKNNYSLIGNLTKRINNKNDYESYSERANAKIELKDYYGAINDFEQSFKLSPLTDDILRELDYKKMLELKFHIKDCNGAISGYTYLIKKTHSLNYYNNRGEVKLFLKDYKGALNDFDLGINSNPNSPFNIDNYLFRGNIKVELKDNKGAILDFSKAIIITINYDEKNGNEASFFLQTLYFNRGLSNFKIKEYKNALADFKMTIQNTNNKFKIASCYYLIGLVNIELHNNDESCYDFKTAKEMFSDIGADYTMVQKQIDSNCKTQ